MAKPIEVTDETFEQAVLQADKPTLVDFWAVWCGPCVMIAPVVAEIGEEYEEQLQVAKLDVDHNPESAMKFGVMSIPTLLLFKDGQPVERLIGFMPKKRLLDRITPHL